MTEEQAKDDFVKRIENYRLQYQPLDEEMDEELSYIKVRLVYESVTFGLLCYVSAQLNSILYLMLV